MAARIGRASGLHLHPRAMRLLLHTMATALVAALAGCGPPEMHPPPGMLTVRFTPKPVSVPDLTLTSGLLRLTHLLVFGDAPPPPPMRPPDVIVDLVSSGTSFTFEMLPPGFYSRLQLSVDMTMPEMPTAQGTWRGTPFRVQLGMFGGLPVDLRSATGQEVRAGVNGTFEVTIDPGSWFAGDLLDGAMVSGGQILCDPQNNQPITDELNRRVGRSFSLP